LFILLCLLVVACCCSRWRDFSFIIFLVLLVVLLLLVVLVASSWPPLYLALYSTNFLLAPPSHDCRSSKRGKDEMLAALPTISASTL
jgi:hypothetical protein